MTVFENPSPTRHLPRGKRVYAPSSSRGDSSTALFDAFIYPAYNEPANPGIQGIYRLDADHIIVSGVVGGNTSRPTLNIWNIADPANAYRVSQLVGPFTNSNQYTDKLLVVGNFVFWTDTATSINSLYIVDCSDRSNPFIANTIVDDMFENAECFTVNPNTGIGAVVGGHFPAQLGVFDASALLAGSPTITLLGTFADSRYDSGAFVQWFDNATAHNRLIITTFFNQIHGVNMANPLNPVIYNSITNTTVTSGVEYVAIRDDHSFAYTVTSPSSSSNQQIQRITLTNPAALPSFAVANANGTDRMWQLVCQQASDGHDYLYATSLKGGSFLSRYDVSGSGAPSFREAVVSSRIGPYAVCVTGDALVIVGGGWPVYSANLTVRDWFVPVQYTDIVSINRVGTIAFTEDNDVVAGTATRGPALSLVGTVTDSLLDRVDSVIVDGTEAYLGSSPNDRFIVCNVTAPGTPTVTTSVTSSSKVDNVSALAVWGNYLLVLSPIDSQVYVYDITTPGTPTDIGSNYVSAQIANATDIQVLGNYAYIAARPAGDDGFVVLDLTTIAPGVGPTFVASVVDSRFNLAEDLYVTGTLAYQCANNEDRLVISNIASPASPVVVGSIQDSTNLNAARCVIVDGTVAYVTNGSSPVGLSAIDVSNPASPTLLDHINVTGGGRLCKLGDYVFITDSGNDTVHSVKVTDPSNLVLGHSLTDATNLDGVTDIATDGTYLYCACFNGDRLTILQFGITSPTLTFAQRVHTGTVALPAAYWQMNDTSSPVVDEIAAKNGTQTGTVTYSQAPLRSDLGNGVLIGANGGFSTATGLVNGVASFSVFAWVKTTGTGEMIVVQQRDASGSGFLGEWVLGTFGPSGSVAGRLYFWAFTTNSAFEFTLDSGATLINDGNRHFVHGSVNQATNTASLWIDGVSVASAATTGHAFSSALQIGIGRDIRDGARSWVGDISNVGIALSAYSPSDWSYLFTP